MNTATSLWWLLRNIDGDVMVNLCSESLLKIYIFNNDLKRTHQILAQIKIIIMLNIGYVSNETNTDVRMCNPLQLSRSNIASLRKKQSEFCQILKCLSNNGTFNPRHAAAYISTSVSINKQWNFPLGIWCFAIASILVAVTSLIKWELVRTGFSHMSSRQYQE